MYYDVSFTIIVKLSPSTKDLRNNKTESFKDRFDPLSAELVLFITITKEMSSVKGVGKPELRNRASSKMVIEPFIIKAQNTGDGEPGEIVVNYDSTDHFQVLFQMRGSVWPRVLPFCIANTFLMFFCDFWLEPIFTNMGIVFTGKEYGLLTIMVSFLVIRQVPRATSVSYLSVIVSIYLMFSLHRRAAMAVGRYEKVRASLNLVHLCK
jgi:hypothetical protein